MLEPLDEEIELVARTVETLQFVREEEPVGLKHAAAELSVPEHRIRTSFRILEESGVIRATDDGAVTTELTEDYLAAFDAEIESVRADVAELGDAMTD